MSDTLVREYKRFLSYILILQLNPEQLSQCSTRMNAIWPTLSPIEKEEINAYIHRVGEEESLRREAEAVKPNDV